MWSMLCWKSCRAGSWTRDTYNPGKMPLLHRHLFSFSISALGCLVEMQMVLMQVKPGPLQINIVCSKAAHEFIFVLTLVFVGPRHGRCSVKQNQLAGFCSLSRDLRSIVDHGSVEELKMPSWEDCWKRLDSFIYRFIPACSHRSGCCRGWLRSGSSQEQLLSSIS